jgi:hypothetical protein
VSTEPYNPEDHSDIELGNKIETFNFKKLIKVKPYKGKKKYLKRVKEKIVIQIH